MSTTFEQLREQLELAWRGRGLDRCLALELHASSSSTMDDAARALRLRGQSEQGLACFSVEQLAGRGTKGRAWYSQAGEGIYVTFAWSFDFVAPTAGISLVTGLAVLQLCQHFGVSASLKWPNDVVVEKGSEFRKLAGVLCETASQGEASSEILLGVGLNLAQRRFPAEVPGVSLTQLLARELSYVDVAVELAQRTEKLLRRFWSQGFAPFVEDYNSHSILNGRKVEVQSCSTQYDAVVLRVAEDGALLLVDREGAPLRPLYSGEVRLRAAA